MENYRKFSYNYHKILSLSVSLSVVVKNIKIFNGCEMQIDNSVTKLTVRHHEACRMMPNSYPEWWNFQFAPINHYWFFFLHTLPSTIVFKLEYALFYQFYAKICIFSIKKCLVWLLSTTSWHHAQGCLTPPCIRQKYPERVITVEKLVWYARMSILLWIWNTAGHLWLTILICFSENHSCATFCQKCLETCHEKTSLKGFLTR